MISRRAFLPRFVSFARACVLGAALAATALVAPWGCGGPPAPAQSLPPGITWNGGWETTFGPLVLEQKGDEVLGVYKYPNGALITTGVLAGRMHGARLEFTWEEREGGTARGKGSFEMAPDGASFTGRWGYADSARDGVEWIGTRVK